ADAAAGRVGRTRQAGTPDVGESDRAEPLEERPQGSRASGRRPRSCARRRCMTTAEINEGYRLSPQQRRVWGWMCRPAQDVFTAWCSVRLAEPCDAGDLHDALRGLVSRHEILRTAFR